MLLISIEFSFHFGVLWYSSPVINFLRFSKWYFRAMKIVLLRYSQNNYQIWLYRLNLMCDELSYQIKYFSYQSSCLLLLLVCKNHYRKSYSVSSSEQRRDALFWINLRDLLARIIWIALDVSEFLNIHIFNWYKALYSASSSTFRHLGFIRAVRWLCAASPMAYS